MSPGFSERRQPRLLSALLASQICWPCYRWNRSFPTLPARFVYDFARCLDTTGLSPWRVVLGWVAGVVLVSSAEFIQSGVHQNLRRMPPLKTRPSKGAQASTVHLPSMPRSGRIRGS